ncbi:hypothetical protein GDO81_007434 [Engystomops pustulosus]|uniref:Uncharacterized protein n=1 Tax=Engystomops pustulosus TaxID=76066 RepID=A0AAV7C7G0_ENGPU|nr:hypothetical protein GDO81_007434 [Engystomops pustulosus]
MVAFREAPGSSLSGEQNRCLYLDIKITGKRACSSQQNKMHSPYDKSQSMLSSTVHIHRHSTVLHPPGLGEPFQSSDFPTQQGSALALLFPVFHSATHR